MATATVTWPAVSGAISYKIEYKKTSDVVWIIANPAQILLTQTITGLDSGTSYDFRVTATCAAGNGGSGYTTGTTPCIINVPLAQEYISEAPIPNPDTIGIATNRPNVNFGVSGTKIYPLNGFNPDGSLISGYSTTNITSASFWNNPTGILGAGKLNATCVWRSNNCITGAGWSLLTGEWIGFSFDYYSNTAGKILYVGMGAMDQFQIIVNGATIVSTPTTASDNYLWWHIYPIKLMHGNNIIYLMGKNTSGSGLATPAFGAEIYDNTQSQLVSATSDLDLNIVYSTTNEFCNPFLLGTTVGNICNPGYYYSRTTNTCVKRI